MDPQEPITNTFTPVEKPVVSEVPKTTKETNTITVVSMAIFVLLSLGAVAFLYYQNQQLKSMLANYQTPIVSATPSAVAEPTVNWRAYTTNDNKFSFKAPENFVVKQQQDFVSVASNDGDILLLSYTTDGTKPKGYSGTSAGDFTDGGMINFLGLSVQKTRLVFNNILTSNLFGGKVGDTNAIIKSNGNNFIISESFVSKTTGEQPFETIFDQILSTFKFLEVPTANPTSSPKPSTTPISY